MLPNSLYKLLPYFYISLGLLCALLVESRMVLLPSALLVATGALVLWMRYRNAVEPEAYIDSSDTRYEEESEVSLAGNEEIPDHERRIGDERDFPLLDDQGNMIAFNRRAKNVQVD